MLGIRLMFTGLVHEGHIINPLTAKLINRNFHPLGVEWLRGKVIQVQNAIFSVYVILGKLNI